MNEYQVIWYTMDQEVKRDTIRADKEEEVLPKAYEMYGGKENAPAPLVTVIAIKNNERK